MEQVKYWIGVLAQDQVERARLGGYAELNQGRPGLLERMRAGDRLVFYSPRASDPKGAAVQAFTAMGEVVDGTMYRIEGPEGGAFRLRVAYAPAEAAPIKPLLEQLSFIRNRQHWGAAFRFGGLRVSREDFARIAAAMGCTELPVTAIA